MKTRDLNCVKYTPAVLRGVRKNQQWFNQLELTESNNFGWFLSIVDAMILHTKTNHYQPIYIYYYGGVHPLQSKIQQHPILRFELHDVHALKSKLQLPPSPQIWALAPRRLHRPSRTAPICNSGHWWLSVSARFYYPDGSVWWEFCPKSQLKPTAFTFNNATNLKQRK